MTFSGEINRSLTNKKIDAFYVKFFRFPSNKSNILGRQVKGVERPIIEFNTYPVNVKGKEFIGIGKIRHQPITIRFADDNYSLVNRALYEQVKYQEAHSINNDNIEQAEKATFDLQIDIYEAQDGKVEIIKLDRCFITNITHTEQVTSDSIDNEIIVTIIFNSLCLEFPELE